MTTYSMKRVKNSDGKSDVSGQPAQPPKCSRCFSTHVTKDGLRYTNRGLVQRFLCKDCDYRFSDPYHIIKNMNGVSVDCRVCALETKRVENLAEVETRTMK